MLAVASALILLAVPPQPYISAGPAEGAQLTRSSATFEFRVLGRPGYLYECKIGGRTAMFRDCSSGTFTVTGLAVGTHTFSVRTADGDDVSPTVERTWTITAIDDDGDGSALPADCNDANPAIHPAATEIAANGIDENCDAFDPPAAPAPVTPAAPSATPTPSPAPAPAAKPKLDVTLSYFMRASKRSTRFSTLSLKRVPSGATIKIKCTGGCPRKRVTIRGKRGTVALKVFRNRAIRKGAKLTIAVTKPGSIGMAKVVTIRAGKRPRIATRTLS